ncbi:MAG: NAD(P)H-dependent glycerol-3-phosphate dehydrogenase [Pseudomonadota bacterium]
MQQKISVLGLGNFGTALARNWLEAGHLVSGWTVEQDVFDSISVRQVNEKYLPGVVLEGLSASMDIGQAINDARVVVLALPSGVVLDVVDQLIPHLQGGEILMDLAKGLAPGDRLISDVIEEKLSAADLHNPLCVMMGPTIAPEVARGVYSKALVASRDAALAQEMATALTTPSVSLSAAADPLGAEYWGAFKNVIALACGVVDGLKEDGRGGDNLKAAVFTVGYAEAVKLIPLLGAQHDTAFSPAGIGDLFVTATSPHGRNREMGERLGRGQSLAEAEGDMVMVSEGVRAARMFKKLFAGQAIPAPFVDAVCDLLDGRDQIDQFLQKMMRSQ